MKLSQIYLLPVLLLSLSCSMAPTGFSQSKNIPETASLFQEIPQPLDFNKRGLASQDDEYTSKSFKAFFSDENYYNRLIKIRKLVSQLSFLMSEKGHPRENILQKFKSDLDNVITALTQFEQTHQETLFDWIPDKNKNNYEQKIQSLVKVDKSFTVMQSLEKYLSSTKVMDEDTYEQNFYYLLMDKAMKQLHQQLTKANVKGNSDLPSLDYVYYLNSVLRKNLPFYFVKEQRKTQKLVDSFALKIQQSKSINEIRNIMNSKESKQVRSYLGLKDLGFSSDIEGFNLEMNRKIATYFSFEMIRYLAK